MSQTPAPAGADARFNRFPQIDFIKCLAIVSVILLHSLSLSTTTVILEQFHIMQAVPVFFVLMGITSYISFTNRGETTFRGLYSLRYFTDRFWRIIVPFLAAFAVSLAVGIRRGDFYFGWKWLIGLLPVSGPGNYFVTILLQYIVVAPLIFLLYRKSPNAMLLALFSFDIAFELAAPHIGVFTSSPYLYSASIFRYLSAIALGLCISREVLTSGRVNVASKENAFILVLIAISLTYLVAGRFWWQPFPLFREEWRTQNVLAFAYPLLLVIMAFNSWGRITRLIGMDNLVSRGLLKIGEASYHVFLAQILFFGFGYSFVGDSYLRVPMTNHTLLHVRYLSPMVGVALNVVTTVGLGVVFYLVETRVTRLIRALAARPTRALS